MSDPCGFSIINFDDNEKSKTSISDIVDKSSRSCYDNGNDAEWRVWYESISCLEWNDVYMCDVF